MSKNLYEKNGQYFAEVEPNVFYSFDPINNRWVYHNNFIVDQNAKLLNYDDFFGNQSNNDSNDNVDFKNYDSNNNQSYNDYDNEYNSYDFNQNQVIKNNDIWFENLTIRNLSYTYKKNNYKSLDNVSINIGAGEFHVFTGDNGAGKSTTIKIIVGILNDYDGSITINGNNIIEYPGTKKVISYVSDQTIFPEYFTVYEYLYLLGSNYSKSKSTLKNRILRLLEQFDMKDQKKANPNKLSLGQKKKILLIRALLEKAELIILDEPVANLDPTTKLQILKLLKEIQNQGISIFVSTHLLDDIKNFATHLSLISKGQIKYSGPVSSEEFARINYEHFSSNSKKSNISEVVYDVMGERSEQKYK